MFFSCVSVFTYLNSSRSLLVFFYFQTIYINFKNNWEHKTKKTRNKIAESQCCQRFGKETSLRQGHTLYAILVRQALLLPCVVGCAPSRKSPSGNFPHTNDCPSHLRIYSAWCTTRKHPLLARESMGIIIIIIPIDIACFAR